MSKYFKFDYAYVPDEWGIGISIGKAEYCKWKYFAALDIFCLLFVIWFGDV